MLDHIQIILVGITHPGNIGATARAMKTMGLSHLRLVQPKSFPNVEATARASGADDILMQAPIYDSFEDSLHDCHLILGTTARPRSIAWPALSPRLCAKKALEIQEPVALVFGREHSGLTNQELDCCHYMVQIPTNPTFSSLNIAAAVQILAYELKVKSDELALTNDNHSLSNLDTLLPAPASAEAMAQFYQHLEQTLIDIEFLDPQKPRRLMRRLHRLFNRAKPIDSEINILRGILTATQAQTRRR